ncbi:outer membrane beta-barrel protein [Myxococcota bacterium]|nr:outer membrane beta-barrel protein [Myxococcota bacterium]MBU1432245.1 outer membrane beta-barrel protein [Myxococcota bacterium]MBU1900000.1 outer membrane beta-barrel protein [Myxococcota bacterium]
MTRVIFALMLLLPAYAAADKTVGSMEFLLGMGSGFEAKPDSGPTFKGDMGATLGITPAIEKLMGSSVAVGGEWMFLWFNPDEGDAESRLIMSPHLRARMSFPIVNKVTADAMIGIGPTFWTTQEGGDSGGMNDWRMGWSLRFGFGASYAINKGVAAFTQLGYYTSTSFGDDLEANLNTVPLSVGLRSTF